MNYLIPTLLAGAVLLLAIPNALHAADPGNGKDNGPCPRKERILKRFDTNHDGILDAQEKAAAQQFRAERRQKLLDRFDTNGDGQLDETERQAAKAARAAHRHGHHEESTGATPKAQ